MIGKTVSHYQIMEKLGGGAMGVVYKAQDLKLDRLVALKFLPVHHTGEDEPKRKLLRERFVQEAKAASALDHPNIGTIHEIDETEDGQVFIVMAYYRGETLKKKIDRGPLPIEETIHIVSQIARGLEKAHAQGIVHRDIKPANVMVTEDGEVKIIDFGLAKLEDVTRMTARGMMVGTVAYMSPEQVRAENVDERADVWALGVVLFEMLTGRLPFQGEHSGAVTHGILNSEPASPKKLRKDTPDELAAVVSRALEKDVSQRLRSSSVVAELAGSVSGESTLSGEEKAHLTRTRRGRIAAVATLVLLLGVAVAWMAYRSSRLTWANTEALPEIQRLADAGDYTAAVALAEEVEKVVSEDSLLEDIWARISRQLSIETIPAGADLFMKAYAASDAEWRHVGRSPIDKIRIPVGLMKWRAEKAGFASELRAGPIGSGDAIALALNKEGELPSEMTMIPGGDLRTWMAGVDPLESVSLGDFLMDRHEVTNQQYKAFIDAGGYKEKKYWINDFIDDGKTLSWGEAMSHLTDATGRPGPATWQAGSYPDGQDHYPVAGVSWYEAAAYAEFVGKSLPTIYHWVHASGTFNTGTYVTPHSNYGGEGTTPVGSLPGMSPFGTFDMAGNVREWSWNRSGELRYILGGSWQDPSYTFAHAHADRAFDRSSGNGFRCVRYLEDKNLDVARRSIELSHRDYKSEQPVSDDVFEVYKQQFAYDRAPLNERIEHIDDSPANWVRETVSFDAAYGGERVIAYLFTPKSAPPPYQTVIFYPGSGAIWRTAFPSSPPRYLSFLPKSGRAFIVPILKGTYERSDGLTTTWPNMTHKYVDYVVRWIKDIRRTVDYLETRKDIDADRLAYLGVSWGGRLGLIIPAVEDRLKVNLLFSGGLAPARALPEVDQINYVTRVQIPTLMLNGRHDSIEPLEMAQKPMLSLLGTPPEHKRHVTYDSGHSMPLNPIIKESLDWLDRYLGPIQ